MKALALSLMLVATVSFAARADFTIVQNVEGKGQNHEITLKIKGDKIRMEATPQMTINGYEADEYLAESKQFKAHYWIAQSFPNSAAVLQQLQAIVPAAWNDL